jgi:hypothetical protein
MKTKTFGFTQQTSFIHEIMKTRIVHFLVPALLFASASTGQVFQNLDFDSASQTFPFPGDHYTTVATALPGWNAYVGGEPFTSAFYNTIPLDSSYVGIFDQDAPSYMPKPFLDEGFGAVLAAGFGGDVWLTQTGQIPVGSSSISFWTTGPTGFTQGQHDSMVGFAINGQPLVLSSIDEYEGWTCWGAGISAFAGTVAEIRFSLSSYYAPGNLGAYEMYVDDISIPEPRVITFVAWCVALLVAFRTWAFNRQSALSLSSVRFLRR